MVESFDVLCTRTLGMGIFLFCNFGSLVHFNILIQWKIWKFKENDGKFRLKMLKNLIIGIFEHFSFF